MTLEETIEKVNKRIKNEIETISELTHGFQIDMRETTIYKEHDTLAREYLHIKMFLKKLQNMKDEQKKFNFKVHEIIKQAKEKMYEVAHADADGWDTVIDLDDVVKILDDMIKESEE